MGHCQADTNLTLPDTQKPLAIDPNCEPKDGLVKKKEEAINIDINLIMGKFGDKKHGEDCDKDKHQELDFCGGGYGSAFDKCDKEDGFDDDDTDWKSIAKQLIQAVSMMDSHTDGAEAGTETPEGALDAIDSETSRVLWGKQEKDNPMSSYQNANYGHTTANGMVMTNPAVLFNKDAYGSQLDPDMDGDVDFHNPQAVEKVDKAQGFRNLANKAIMKQGKQDDKEQYTTTKKEGR